MEDSLRLSLPDCLAIYERLKELYPHANVVRQPSGRDINFLIKIWKGLRADLSLTEETGDPVTGSDYMAGLELIRDDWYEYREDGTSLILRRIILIHYSATDDKIELIANLLLDHLKELIGKITHLQLGTDGT